MSNEVVIISGLPRSGTSMVMQMLAASGMPILTDGLRQADTDNPRGYFEYEPVKSIQRGAAWFNEAKGKAVKVVAPLLPHLPSDVQYRVIFIHRNLEETISSQTVMLQHRRENLEDTPERRACLKEEYSKLLVRVTSSLASRSNTQFLFLEYDAVLADPGVAASRMNRFLGGVLDEASAAEAVAPELHRRRKATVA